MIDSRVVIPKIEFYITNVCNLTCDNCNRFNNYNFSGWQRWSDYADMYAEWAKHIKIYQIVVLGGEPLLNPTIIDWVKGINQLWPNGLQILTNGTRLNHVAGLYELLVGRVPAPSTVPDIEVGRNFVGVSLHNSNEAEIIFDEIRKFLKSPIREFVGKDSNPMNADYYFTDVNNVSIPVWLQDEFIDAAVQQSSERKFVLFNNSAESAHAGCVMAQYKSYHFIRGKLYKCGPVALFPEFDAQHGLNLDASDRALINAYRPLSPYKFEDRGRDFLAHIDDPIPQCKFCPASTQPHRIYAVRKGKNLV